MLQDRWITDRTPTERFPDYTRANAGEVLANPVTPLGWTWCWESGVVLGCRAGFVSYGVFDPDEYSDPPETFGSFGGYFYNSLTQARLMGVRMPGASPEAIDEAYFDAHPDVPPYVTKPWHESPEHSARLEQTGGYLVTTDRHQPIEDQKVLAERLRASRPDLAAATDEELVGRARAMQPHIVDMFEQHVWASLGASTGPGILGALLGGLGRADDTVRLLTGIGGVDSADIGRALWQLSREVRRSPELTAAYDDGLDDLHARIQGTAYGERVAAFIYEHGSRGPDEWDPGAASYETTPRLIHAQIDVMRRQGDEADPMAALERNAAERDRIAAEIREALADDAETLAMFEAGLKAGAVWMAARERCKGNNIRTIHEVRVCFDELGRRMAERGHLEDPKTIYMLLEHEIDAYLEDPASFADVLTERRGDFATLMTLEPPFIVNGSCPPLADWPRKADLAIHAVAAGDVLSGVACSPGTVTGRARVLLDATDPSALEPGDILVTVNTDPSWTPLFLAAGAVVTNVGAIGSHASIVSRELGIPCVASVPDASRRIPDGALITVDGARGTVTIDALP